MSLNTWSRNGSEKAQASQTIRMLLKTLQYLAEDAAADDRERGFLKVARAVIQNTFTPSSNFSTNEQVSVVFNTMGWKNTQIKLTSANEADILLGSNRHLDQNPDSEEGLRVLVKLLSEALGSYLFDREADAVVDIDIHTGPTYRIKLRAKKDIEIHQKQQKQAEQNNSESSSSQSKLTNNSRSSSNTTSHQVASGVIQTDQIFLPVLNNKLPISRLYLILQDVLAEFSSSWYGENPLDNSSSDDERENVLDLVSFLTTKAAENDTSIVEVGEQIGNYFGQALQNSFQEDDLLSPEILEGSAVGSIIRDIKSRAFCYLNPGEKCGPDIGGANREICDFVMGLWGGFMSTLEGEKNFKFTGFYPAGRRDPYCLMEFEVN